MPEPGAPPMVCRTCGCSASGSMFPTSADNTPSSPHGRAHAQQTLRRRAADAPQEPDAHRRPTEAARTPHRGMPHTRPTGAPIDVPSVQKPHKCPPTPGQRPQDDSQTPCGSHADARLRNRPGTSGRDSSQLEEHGRKDLGVQRACRCGKSRTGVPELGRGPLAPK